MQRYGRGYPHGHAITSRNEFLVDTMARRTMCFPRLIYVLTALTTIGSVAAELGDLPAGGFRSPEGDARFSKEQGVKPLNNLVFELLNQESPGTDAYTFRNPRDGWVYIRVALNSDIAQGAVLLDGETVALKRVGDALEAMRYSTEGEHTVQLGTDQPAINRLEVRVIGDLVYATYGLDPHIAETGVYTWEYLRQHCLDHYNSIIGMGDGVASQAAELREWTAEGKRWYTREAVPYDVANADEAYARWANSPGMAHPLMSGIWGDEFGIGEKYGKKTADMYPIWIEAVRRLHANPAFANRSFYAYGPSRLLPESDYTQMHPFIQTLLESGYHFAPEWYLPEGQSRPGRIIEETGDLLAEFSPGWELSSRESFELADSGAATERVIALLLFSEPGWENGDLFASYNFNVFLDAQLQFIATDPAFFGVRGLQGYLSGYCGEEQTRLFAQLVRHYAIEGNTTRFLSDPYVLPHLQNPDLSDGTNGWTFEPAVDASGQGSIGLKIVPGFGTLQGKYHAPEGTGDVAFWTRRSAERPNVISQTIQKLTPGRLYSLRLITGDSQEFSSGVSVQRKHAVSVSIENVEPVAEKSFQAVVPAGFWYSHGAFNAQNPYCLNYHQQVFRARAETAELRLSDWASADSPSGPEGEEFLWNFIQVQPYFE